MAEQVPLDGSSQLTLYVLELCEGKYYIGSTSNLHQRFQDHLSGRGSAWTRKYPPKKILLHTKGSRYGEDPLVYEFMSRYGIENVRGGTHSSIKLSKESREQIKRQFDHSNDKCFHCREVGHFMSRCPQMQNENPYKRRLASPNKKKERFVCERCGRDSHTAEDCFASRHKNGDLLVPDWSEDDSSESEDEVIEVYETFPSRSNHSTVLNHGLFGQEVCQRCGRDSHTTDGCYASYHANGEPLGNDEDEESEESEDDEEESEEESFGAPLGRFFGQRTTSCFRCGREGHYQSECYARRHVNGRTLY